MAIQFFQKPVHSAHSDMKVESRGYCVSVFDSSGSLLFTLDIHLFGFRVVSEANLRLVMPHLALWYPALYRVLSWILHQVCDIFYFSFWIRSGRWYMFDFSKGVIEAAKISSGGDDIRTEVETRSRSRRRRAVVTRRSSPLAGIAPELFVSARRERSRELLEEAFDKGMHHFSCGFFCGVPWLLLISYGCCFGPFQKQSCCERYWLNRLNRTSTHDNVPVHLRRRKVTNP